MRRRTINHVPWWLPLVLAIIAVALITWGAATEWRNTHQHVYPYSCTTQAVIHAHPCID